MLYDGIIFDIDGTLWDASRSSTEGWNRGLEKMKIKNRISAVDLRGVTGHPYETCVKILLPGLSTNYPNLHRIINENEKEAIKALGGDFYEGAIEGIRELSKKFKIFLVSNCQDWYIELFLDSSNLKELLTGLDCYGLSGQSKEQMLRHMKKIHQLVNPVYIGDTAGDEKAARLAGIAFIHVSWGFGKPIGATKSVKTFKELVKYLQG